MRTGVELARMSLEASVRCACLSSGRIQLPAKWEGWIYFDEDGWLRTDRADSSGLFDWEETACEHVDMDLVCVSVDWATYRRFQRAFDDLGWHHFPTLKRYFPDYNDGSLPASAAATALAELLDFEQRVSEFPVWSVEDVETHELTSDWSGVWTASGKGHLTGANENGFFICHQDTAPPMFQARSFTVRACDRTWGEYVSDDGRVFRCCLNALACGPLPTRYELRHVPRPAGHFSYMLNFMRTVFRASVETGNPVRWS